MSRPPNHVPREELKTLCRIGEGAACCRYLAADAGGMECLKHTRLRATVDARVAAGTFTAQGDNCPGKNPPGALETIALVFTPEDLADLDGLRDFAALTPIDVMERQAKLSVDPAYKEAYHKQILDQTCVLSSGITVSFSIEIAHPVGTVRALIVLLPDAMPNSASMLTIAGRLGFVTPPFACEIRASARIVSDDNGKPREVGTVNMLQAVDVVYPDVPPDNARRPS